MNFSHKYLVTNYNVLDNDIESRHNIGEEKVITASFWDYKYLLNHDKHNITVVVAQRKKHKFLWT
jgi:hypothetical protein